MVEGEVDYGRSDGKEAWSASAVLLWSYDADERRMRGRSMYCEIDGMINVVLLSTHGRQLEKIGMKVGILRS